MGINESLNRCFSTVGASPACCTQQHQRRGGGIGVVEKEEEEEGTGIHVAHESHLIPTGRICGP